MTPNTKKLRHAETEPMAQLLNGASTFLRTRMAEDPGRTLALAAGVGLVVGGGFWKILLQPVLLTAARLLLTSATSGFTAQPAK